MTKDQIELLRPGFEAAIIERFKESGFLEVEIRVECLSRCGESYNDPQVAIAWWSWTQSRESLVVELPPEVKQPEGDGLDCDDVEVWEMQSEAAYAVNGMRQACKSAILNGGGVIRDPFVVDLSMLIHQDDNEGFEYYRPDDVEAAIESAGGTVKS